MTTAPQLSVGTTLQTIDDTSCSAFQNVNAPNATQLICGNIFLGLQGYVALAVPIGEQLGLTRGASIENNLINCAVTFVADGSWSAGGAITVHVLVDDSPRYSTPGAGLDSHLAWKPPAGFGPNVWRRDFWGQFDHRLEDTGGTPFVDTGLGNYGGWGIRAIAGLRERLGQPFTVPAGPSWSVARAILELRRIGNPSGSMHVAIQASQDDGFGQPEPDGVDLAVSAAVANSTIPVSPASGPITYAFTPNVVLPPGTYWTVLRSSVQYPVSVTDFVVWMQQRLFFGTGGAHFHTGGGVRFDQGNYPGHVDVYQGALAKSIGSVVWNPPAAVAGQTVQTPDLTALVQEVARRSGHETKSALGFLFVTAGETRTYRFAAHGHPTRNPPGFACQFRRRDTRGEVT